MTNHLSGHQGIFMPLLIVGVLMFVVFVAGVVAGWFVCYLLA